MRFAMPPSSTIHASAHPAPCRGARCLLAMAVGLSLAVALAMASGLLLKAPHDPAAVGAWMRVLALSGPAWQPAGSTGRHPETAHSAVVPAFAAGLEADP